MECEVHHCSFADGVRIASTVKGSDMPIVFMTDAAISRVELNWTHPLFGHLFRSHSERATLIRDDDRDSGLSDRGMPVVDLPHGGLEALVAKKGLSKFA